MHKTSTHTENFLQSHKTAPFRVRGFSHSISILFSLFLFVQISSAQQLSLYRLTSIPQSGQLNPAFQSQYKVSVGVPYLSNFNFNFSNSGFKYTDLVRHDENDSLYFDFENMLTKLGKDNRISASFNTDLFMAAFKIKKSSLTLSISEKAEVNFNYSKDLMEFILHGNAPFIGQQKKLSFALNAMHYREYGINFSHDINKKLTIGLRFKYLNGLQNIQSVQSNVAITTSGESYAINANPNLQINTSGFGDDILKTTSFKNYRKSNGNNGAAVDLGFDYNTQKGWQFSASVLDLGAITWENDVTNYNSTGNSSFYYNGIDLNYFIQDSTDIDNRFNEFLDSLASGLNIDTVHSEYKTNLPVKTYLSAQYNLNKKYGLSLLLFNKWEKKYFSPAISLGYTGKLAKWFDLIVDYSIYNRSYNNVGLGFALSGSGVQYYMISDNASSIFYPHKKKNVHLNFGLNFVFGKVE